MKLRFFGWLAPVFILTIAFWLYFGGNISSEVEPPKNLIENDISTAILLNQKDLVTTELKQIEVLDGWDGGIEIRVKFDIDPLKDAQITDGPLKATTLKKGYKLTGGLAQLSYSHDSKNGWQLLATNIERLPLTEKE